ncbi:MAG: hypothetical protein ACO1SV_19925 [Fimbriimonas sp.]
MGYLAKTSEAGYDSVLPPEGPLPIPDGGDHVYVVTRSSLSQGRVWCLGEGRGATDFGAEFCRLHDNGFVRRFDLLG